MGHKNLVVAAKAYHTAGVTLNNGSYTAIALNANAFDTAGIHSTTVNTTRLVAPVAGKYVVCGSLRYAGNSAGSYRAIQLAKNQVTFASCWAAANVAPLTSHITDIVDMLPGDYIEMYGYQDSGGSLATLAGQDAIFVSMALLK